MSFKLKLVAYFVLLSMLPLAAAFVGFSTVLARSETRVVDAKLAATLHAGLAAFDEDLYLAERDAMRLAGSATVQRALAEADAQTLAQVVAARPTIRISGAGVSAGTPLENVAEVSIRVRSSEAPGRTLGIVAAAVPLDSGLAERLSRRSGVDGGGHAVLVVAGGTVIAGPAAFVGAAGTIPARVSSITMAGERYRALGAPLPQAGDATLAVMTPQATIAAATSAARLRLLLALLAALAVVAGVAYLEGRSIVAALRRLVGAADALASGRLGERVEVHGKDEFAELARSFNEMASQLQERLGDLEAERARLRDATARFGTALSATHDVGQLLRVIVDTAVEATRAGGGLAVGPDGERVQAGDPGAGRERLELELTLGPSDFGRLVLTGSGFSTQDVETATLLAGHASVALENARLHRIVERQAVLDALTGLANRRQAEETLATELRRAERFGSPLAVVFADLDRFKWVNDRHGHPAGDAVLRAFADVLRESLRDIDVAARWGGEEFALILPGTGADGAAAVAERARAALAERRIATPAGPLSVTASFGIAAFPTAHSSEELVAAADGALYQAKRGGRNRVATALAAGVVPAGQR